MKARPIVVLSLALLLAGCVLVPSPFSAQLNPVLERYRSIKKGTARSEVEAQLGQPNQAQPAGAAVWETRFDKLNYATLKLWFDARDKVEQVEITKAHGTSVPGYQASAVSTRAK